MRPPSGVRLPLSPGSPAPVRSPSGLLVQGATARSSTYEPAPIMIPPGPNVSADPKSIFDIKPALDCVAGPSKDAAYYSSGLTPGGLCGDGDYVKDNMRDYAIADGVGGSLLEK